MFNISLRNRACYQINYVLTNQTNSSYPRALAPTNKNDFTVCIYTFDAKESEDIKSMRLIPEPSVTAMLPASFKYMHYITERNGISRMQCFFLFPQHNSTCVGTLVNDEPLQCKLMSLHMNTLTVD